MGGWDDGAAVIWMFWANFETFLSTFQENNSQKMIKIFSTKLTINFEYLLLSKYWKGFAHIYERFWRKCKEYFTKFKIVSSKFWRNEHQFRKFLRNSHVNLRGFVNKLWEIFWTYFNKISSKLLEDFEKTEKILNKIYEHFKQKILKVFEQIFENFQRE